LDETMPDAGITDVSAPFALARMVYRPVPLSTMVYRTLADAEAALADLQEKHPGVEVVIVDRRTGEPMASEDQDETACTRTFELLGHGAVAVHYSCGFDVEFANFGPTPANHAYLDAHIPGAVHPHTPPKKDDDDG